MSNPTAFSYAQAAKGQLAAQPATSQPTPNQSCPPSVADSRDVNNTDVSTRAPSVDVSTTSNDFDSPLSARSVSVKPEVAQSNAGDVNQDDTNTSASVAESLNSVTLRAAQSPVDGTTKNTEVQERSTHAESDTAEQFEGKKARKSRKGKSGEKDSDATQEPEKESPPPKIELSEAPIPAVNVWVQRQEAHKAKTVDQSVPTVGTASNTTQQSADPKSRPAHSEGVDSNRAINGKQGPKRDGEPSRNGTNQGPKRAAPRGVRVHDKETQATLLANNPTSWPTLDANMNQKPQLSVQSQKPEKDDKEEIGTAKPKPKEKWMQLPDFVPTVKWETALPTRGGRGGRVGGSRGGRDVAGNNHNTSNHADRAQETNAGTRTNAGSKRPQVEGSGPREGRKNTTPGDYSRLPKESTSDNTTTEQPKSNLPGVNGATNEPSTASQAPVPSQQAEENVRTSDSHKDIRTQNNRDSHPQNHRGSDRTRGGGRNRGAYAANNSNGMSHHGQPPYMAQHHPYQMQPNGSRHMAPYGPGYTMPYQYAGQPGQRRGANGNRRQGSGRVHAAAAAAAAAAATVAPLGIPYETGMFSPPNGVMYPYDTLNHLHLARSQVEYYFSVDNCVKDMFLRRHMDDQGFVALSLVAQFPRMRDLNVDFNILRQACVDSEVIEFVVGNDGVERVRKQEGWEQWVLTNKDQRDASARHPGPSSFLPFSSFSQQLMSPHYPFPVDASLAFSPTGDHGFAHYANGNYAMPQLHMPTMNGVNGLGRPHESQLSAAVPEFSPSTTGAANGFMPVTQNGGPEAGTLVNGHFNGMVSPHEQPKIAKSVANGGGVHEQPHVNGDGVNHGAQGH